VKKALAEATELLMRADEEEKDSQDGSFEGR
jgi:hypothetical protein